MFCWIPFILSFSTWLSPLEEEKSGGILQRIASTYMKEGLEKEMVDEDDRK